MDDIVWEWIILCGDGKYYGDRSYCVGMDHIVWAVPHCGVNIVAFNVRLERSIYLLHLNEIKIISINAHIQTPFGSPL